MPQILIIPEITLRQEYAQFAEEEVVGFEFNDFYEPMVLNDRVEAMQRIAEYQQVQLPPYTTLHGAFLDVTIFSMDSEIRAVSRKRVEESITYAKKLGARAVIFHTNYLPTFRQTVYRDDWVTCNDEFWKEQCEKNQGIEIYMENMFDLEPELLVRLAEKMKQINNFGICLDYAHAALSNCSLEEWVKTTAPYVKHIHVNDNDLISDLHLEIGTGSIDWGEFASLYHRYLAEPSILIEMRGLEKQHRSLQYLRNELRLPKK